MLPIGLPPIESLRSPTQVSPRRNRMLRMTTSCVSSSTVSPAMHTPSPGALPPSIVMYGARIADSIFEPDDSGDVEHDDARPARFERFAKAARPAVVEIRDDEHLAAAPAEAVHAAALAPGNAGIGACGRSLGFAAHGMYGLPFASHSLNDRQCRLPGFVGVAIGVGHFLRRLAADFVRKVADTGHNVRCEQCCAGNQNRNENQR